MDVVINCDWQSQIRSLSQTCFELEANLAMLSRRLLIIKNNFTQFSIASSYNGSRLSPWEPFINLNLPYSTSSLFTFPHPVCEGSTVISRPGVLLLKVRQCSRCTHWRIRTLFYGDVYKLAVRISHYFSPVRFRWVSTIYNKRRTGKQVVVLVSPILVICLSLEESRPTPLLTRSWTKDLGSSQVLKLWKWQDLLEEGQKMAAMRSQHVQRLNLAAKIFWG